MGHIENNYEVMDIPKNGSQTPATFIQQAIAQGLSIEHLERLMNLQERWQANEARKLFLTAMTEFQSQCPKIEKKKIVDFANKAGGKTHYKYAPIGDIAEQIKPFLKLAGLSYRFEIKDEPGKILVTCIASHTAGHFESTSMMAGKDATGNKNEIQQYGSTLTYLQRYSLCLAFGITTADEDNDGVTSETKSYEKPQPKQSEPVKPKQEPPKQEVKQPDKNTEPAEKKERNYTLEADECMKADNPYEAFSKWWKSLTGTEGKQLKKSNFLKKYQDEIARITKERTENKAALNINNPIALMIGALSKETYERDYKAIESLIDENQDNNQRNTFAKMYVSKLKTIGISKEFAPLPF